MIWPQWGVAQTEISLPEHWRTLVFVLAVTGVGLWLAAEASLAGLVSSFNSPKVGRRLLTWDAGDPLLLHQLGQAYIDTDPAESIRYLRQATQLSPASRLYWQDLELACEAAGDAQCIHEASARLLQLCPMVPFYHWLAAQSCLQTNQLDQALREFQRSLELDPAYAMPTWGSLQDVVKPETVFQKVLAEIPDVQLKVTYVDYLSNNGDNDSAFHIWKLLAANPRPFPFSSAQPYLERLIALGRFEEAASVWKDLERLEAVKRPPEDEKDNLVFNGDFEQLPLNAGFDWRTGDTTYLAVDFSAPGAYRGAHCLRVDFTVSRNDEYEPVYQIVPVLPGHAYRLEAFVRSQDITSDTGPCLRVRDSQPGGFPDAVSETTVGTAPWHRVSVTFSTGLQTRAVRVSFWRPRSRVFPMEISGISWLDAVTLKCLDCEDQRSAGL
jgi:hypothetical protein